MKYSFVTLAAFAAGVLAQPTIQNSDFNVVEGQPFTVKLGGCEEGCTLILQNGPSDDTKDVKVLSSTAGAEFTFTPSGLPSDTYNFKVVDKDGEFNYSKQFKYVGTGTLSTTESSTTAATTTTAETSTSTEATTSTEESTTTEAESTTIVTPTSTKVATTTAVSTPAASTPAQNSTTLSTKTGAATSTQAEETTGSEPASTVSTVPDSGAVRMTSSVALVAGLAAAMVYLA